YRFADDLARVTSAQVEKRIYENLDNIEAFGAFGSRNVPDSIKQRFGDAVRKVAVNPFDLVYTYESEANLAYIEALILRRTAS
ncbi:MAG: sirohydrochlorin cobaltochelatase, partial [Raoultibacter sp.]